MPSLRSQLSAIASDFADAVLAAIRSASLQDLLAESGEARGRPAAAHRVGAGAASPRARFVNGRLARRSQADIDSTLGLVVAMLKATPGEGARSEEIRDFLKLHKRELPGVLKAGLDKKVLRSQGRKRATRYFAA
jgi:hypothetical protein